MLNNQNVVFFDECTEADVFSHAFLNNLAETALAESLKISLLPAFLTVFLCFHALLKLPFLYKISVSSAVSSSLTSSFFSCRRTFILLINRL